MKAYLDILKDVSENGHTAPSRPGIETKTMFHKTFRHDLRNGFPLLTTKKINYRKVVGELFGFLTAADKVSDFHVFDCDIWDSWGLSNDYVDIKHVTNQHVAEKLAELRGISTEEAQQQVEKVISDYAQHAKDRINYEYKLTQELDDPYEIGDKMCEYDEKAPITFKDFCHSIGIESLTYPVYQHHAGDLGPIYGKQWLEWKTSAGETINQLKEVSNTLSTNPRDRRMVVTAWNPEFKPSSLYIKNPLSDVAVTCSKDAIDAAICDGKQALPPCHVMFILMTYADKQTGTPILNMHVIMRSTDVPIGLPYNIASYATLLEMIANAHDMIAGELAIDMTDCHVYSDQLEMVEVQLARETKTLPTIKIPKGLLYDQPSTITKERMDELVNSLDGYDPHPFIKYPVAV